MKVIILAGGYGSRLSEYTNSIPKPMVNISGKPIVLHIMEHFINYGFNNFYLAMGYKSDYIKNYFATFFNKKVDLTKKFICLENNQLNNQFKNCKVNLVETGLNTMTGGRLKKLQKYINKEDFFMTYGDGISNVNLYKLLKFHQKYKKIGTVTAVHPPARFGEMKIAKNNTVYEFKEKPLTSKSWINGGFFIFNYKFFSYLVNNSSILEKEPLENLSKKNQLKAFKHNGFWQCMDTKRDKDFLDDLYKSNNKQWPL